MTFTGAVKKNLVIVGVLLPLIVILSSCGIPRETKYFAKVYADEGLEFTGSIGGGGNSRTIEGIGTGLKTPIVYEINGWPAVAVIQKKEEFGQLIVIITDSNGDIIQQQSTAAGYGVVTVNSG